MVITVNSIILYKGSPCGPVVRNPTSIQEPQVQSLGQEDPLEKEMATHSSILAWKNLMDFFLSLPQGYSPCGHKELDMTVPLST